MARLTKFWGVFDPKRDPTKREEPIVSDVDDCYFEIPSVRYLINLIVGYSLNERERGELLIRHFALYDNEEEARADADTRLNKARADADTRVNKAVSESLKRDIRKIVNEYMSVGGKLRPVRGGGGPKHRIGKIEDENKELSSFEAEHLFPGSTSAWCEIVPELYPDFPFDDPVAIKRGTAWFRIGGKLRVAFKDVPQLELAEWDPLKEDWVEL